MKNILTHKELLKRLSYNSLTGFFKWKISKAQWIKKGDIAGSLNADGYVVIRIDGKLYYAQRLAWFYVHGYMPEGVIDHRDRIRHHNWIENLREKSQQCNMRNTGNPITNTSGVKGVLWDKLNNKWKASISLDNKTKHLGVSESFSEAVCIRLAGEQCLDWSGCDDNSPAFKYVRENIQWWI